MKFDREKFFEGYRNAWGKMFQSQVDALNDLLHRFEAEPRWSDIRHIAYAFATVKHETADTFRPITEYGGKKYFDKYDTGLLAARLGNTPAKDNDGYLYRGRGYVQITGRANYRKFGIEASPGDALAPDISFGILTTGMQKGLFTGHKLNDYIQSLDCDYVKARRIINGKDDANLIAGYARNFERILKAALVVDAKPPVSKSNLVGGGAVLAIATYGYNSGYYVLIGLAVFAAILLVLYLLRKK